MQAWRVDEKLLQEALLPIWEKMMGGMIAERTRSIRLEKGVLTLEITSASLRHELTLGKTKLIELFNKELHGNFVKEIQIH